MSEKKSFTEKTLERIQSGTLYGETKKKRRISKGLLVIDAVLIIILLLYFYNKKPEQEYHTSTINFKGCTIRFSLGDKADSDAYFFSLSLKSDSEERGTLSFHKSLATLQILHNGETIVEKPFGENITSLTLLPGESKMYVEAIEESLMEEYARKHPDYVVPKKRSLLQFEKSNIPLDAKIILNIEEKLSTSIKFKYEVKK